MKFFILISILGILTNCADNNINSSRSKQKQKKLTPSNQLFRKTENRKIKRKLLKRDTKGQIKPPFPLLDVKVYASSIIVDMRYFKRNNIFKQRLNGYFANRCYIHKDVLKNLKEVNIHLNKMGYALKVFDCYRPRSASIHMVKIVKNKMNSNVLGLYIAELSKHNSGTAIDCTLVNSKTKKELEMGTEFDSFSTKSHTLNISGIYLKNRLILKKSFEKFGWKNYWREWWHFHLPLKQIYYYNFPIK
jgi:zinc D-Ala-D-Ala dipeptidase